jgi:cell division protein FtsQ
MRKKRGSSRYYILFIFILILVVSSFSGVKYLLQNVDFFQIKFVEVIGNKNLEREFLSNISKDFIGKNLFKVSQEDIMQKYKNINRIKSIEVSRKLPNKLLIKITEKSGYLYIKSVEGELFPITKDKEILDNTRYFNSEILPVVTTNFPTKELEVGKIIKDEWINQIFSITEKLIELELLEDISEFYQNNDEIILVQSPIGYRIIPGTKDLIKKFKRYKFIRDNRSFSRNDCIDLRYENKLIIGTGV